MEHLKKSTFEWFGPNSVYENTTNAVYKAKKGFGKVYNTFSSRLTLANDKQNLKLLKS